MPSDNLVLKLILLLIGHIYKLHLSRAIPIDNGITAQPDVGCLQNSMKIYFQTRNPFYGHVYIKGMFQVQGCHIDFTGDRKPRTSIVYEVPYRGCIMVTRERSVSPPGLSYTATVIIQFHHLFLTKVDRAYRLTCFYMEAEKLVTQNIQVSMIPPTEIQIKRRMPTCYYKVVADNLNGPLVRFAKVGDKVYHKWTCEEGIHGILVHSCVARDGAGTTYRLVDKQGCALDPIALGDLQYSDDLSAAWVQVHVFKFADQMLVAFQCQITLCVKAEYGCRGITPPECDKGGGYSPHDSPRPPGPQPSISPPSPAPLPRPLSSSSPTSGSNPSLYPHTPTFNLPPITRSIVPRPLSSSSPTSGSNSSLYPHTPTFNLPPITRSIVPRPLSSSSPTSGSNPSLYPHTPTFNLPPITRSIVPRPLSSSSPTSGSNPSLYPHTPTFNLPPITRSIVPRPLSSSSPTSGSNPSLYPHTPTFNLPPITRSIVPRPLNSSSPTSGSNPSLYPHTPTFNLPPITRSIVPRPLSSSSPTSGSNPSLYPTPQPPFDEFYPSKPRTYEVGKPRRETYTLFPPPSEPYTVFGPPQHPDERPPIIAPPGPPGSQPYEPPLITYPPARHGDNFPIHIPRTFRPPYTDYDDLNGIQRTARAVDTVGERNVEKNKNTDAGEERLREDFDNTVLADTLDLSSQDILVFNLEDSFPDEYKSKFDDGTIEAGGQPSEVCISKLSMTQTIASLVLFFSSLLIVFAFCQRRYYLERISNVKGLQSF